MGCSSSKHVKESASVQSRIRRATLHYLDTEVGNKDFDDNDDTENYVTMEEAVTYVSIELGMSKEKAENIVRTVDENGDGRISPVELVLLNERIKQIKEKFEPKFRAFDKESKGFVLPEEAVQILESEFDGLSPHSLMALVKQFDKDSNGLIDFNEFVEFYACTKAKRQNLDDVFRDLDKDKSGDLDASELIEVLKAKCGIDYNMAQSLVNDFDVNHDGKLDKEEFMTMWVTLFE